MDAAELRDYALAHVEPLAWGDEIVYRCAATLKDGLHLPCVVLASEEPRVALAKRRLAVTQRAEGRWPWSRGRPAIASEEFVLRAFVTGGNTLNAYDIDRLESSPFALPAARMAEIRGETSMGWTQFVGVMGDGSEASFGSTFHWEFFSIPEGYTAVDVARIRPHERAPGPLYRERPFFTCYVPGLQVQRSGAAG